MGSGPSVDYPNRKAPYSSAKNNSAVEFAAGHGVRSLFFSSFFSFLFFFLSLLFLSCLFCFSSTSAVWAVVPRSFFARAFQRTSTPFWPLSVGQPFFFSNY